MEYELDTVLMTATKVWEFVHPDSLYTPSTGGVQRLPNGNTLINFGNLQWLNLGSIVTEVDSNGQIVFQLEYDYGNNLYRAQKFDWFFNNQIIGCMDQVACNYNPNANMNDSNLCCYSSPTQIVIIDTCDSYYWNNTYYSISGNHIRSFTNECGCDSSVVLNLTLNYSSFSSISDTAYDNYLWNGNSYSQSGQYTFNGTTNYGCDSLIELNLTIINTTNINEFLFNNNNYKIINLLGKEILPKKYTPYFILHKNGRVEKKIIIE